jgi:hypothetical protein
MIEAFVKILAIPMLSRLEFEKSLHLVGGVTVTLGERNEKINKSTTSTMRSMIFFRPSALVLLSVSILGEILKASAFDAGILPSCCGSRRTIDIAATTTNRGRGGVVGAKKREKPTFWLRSSKDHDTAYSYIVDEIDHGRLSNGRRSLIRSSLQSLCLVAAATTVTTAAPSMAAAATTTTAETNNDDEDLTASLYNPDGSIKANVASEATSRTVSFRLPTIGDQVEAMDGKPMINNDKIGSKSNNGEEIVDVSYQLPDKWTDQYTDNGQSVCRRISVYKTNTATTTPRNDLLASATKNGVTQTLETSRIGLDGKADLMSGAIRDGYYEFDLGSYSATPILYKRSHPHFEGKEETTHQYFCSNVFQHTRLLPFSTTYYY